MTAVEHQGDDLLLTLKVQPKASKDELLWHGEQLKARITAPPVDGRANAHLQAWLAKLFGVSKSQVTLLSGETGRNKRLRIASPRQVPDLLNKSGS